MLKGTWEFIDLSDTLTDAGLGRLVSTLDSFCAARTDSKRSWDGFYAEIEKFRGELTGFAESDLEPYIVFESFHDERHFSSSGVRLLRTIVHVCSYYRRRSLRDSPKLAFLLGDFENWSTANLPRLEQVIWRVSSDPDIKATETMEGYHEERLGELLARLTNLNTVLHEQTHVEIRDFRAKNERFISALGHYVTKTRASFVDLDESSVVTVAQSIEPKVNSIRDEAYALSKEFESINVVHILLLELERHMIDSLVVIKRLKWLRPR